MNTLTIITIHLVSAVLSYIIFRWIYSYEWTVSKRTYYILFSLLGMFSIVYVLFYAIYKSIVLGLNNNNKANW